MNKKMSTIGGSVYGGNKKISSELAVGIVLLVAIITGGYFWNMGKIAGQEILPVVSLNLGSKNVAPTQKANESNVADSACQPHYYEGIAQVHSWLDQQGGADSNGLKVKVKLSDVAKLPVHKTGLTNSDPTMTLIDPTAQIKNSLKSASSAKPAAITVRGYAEDCQAYPQISLQKATIAFKKT